MRARNIVLLSVFLVAVVVVAWNISSRIRSNYPSDAPAPSFTITADDERTVSQSRDVEPDIFGDPLARLAALSEEDARLAMLVSDGDQEILAVTALFWAMTPEDVRRHPDKFIQTLDSANKLLSSLGYQSDRGEPLNESEIKQLSTYISIWSDVVLAADPAYDSVMPSVSKLCSEVLDRLPESGNLVESCGATLWQLQRNSWLDPEGEVALSLAYSLNPNLEMSIPNWHEQSIREFMTRKREE